MHEMGWHRSGWEGLSWNLALRSHCVASGSRLVERLRNTRHCFLVGKLEVGREGRGWDPTCDCSPGMFREGGEVGRVPHQP